MHTRPSTARSRRPAGGERLTRATHGEGGCGATPRARAGTRGAGRGALWASPSVEGVGRKAQLHRTRGAVRLHRRVSARAGVRGQGGQHRAAPAPAVSRRDGGPDRKSRHFRLLSGAPFWPLRLAQIPGSWRSAPLPSLE